MDRVKHHIKTESRQNGWSWWTRRRRLRELRGLLRQYFAAVDKAAAFAFYERLFALWHVLHMPLFVLNLVLILYAVYGYMVPGMFYHAGLSWHRVITAMSVETTTGVFSNLPQIALTVVGAFLLVLSVLSGYGCIESLLRATKRVANRSAHALPQSAVIGSMCVGTVSGSGAANAITIGSATIPAMIGAGMPPATAAAIESASSLGGQLMPPVMGVAAFLMAEFMGKSYFDVVARGYVPALIYYATVAVSVYLLALRHRTRHDLSRPPRARPSARKRCSRTRRSCAVPTCCWPRTTPSTARSR